MCGSFEKPVDADLISKGKKVCDISASTECTVMAVLAFKKEKDKGKLRSLMQSVVKHVKEIQASYVGPTDNASQPTAILHDALKKRIAAALRLR